MKTILVPLDGSAIAEQILPAVRMLAPIMGAKVNLLHVVPEMDRFQLETQDDFREPFATEREQRMSSWDTLRHNAERYLEPQAAALRAAGIGTTFEVRLGAPAEIIVDVSERGPVDLVAIATHGYSGIKRWALGSVTDKLVHAVHMPVLVVRGSAEPPVTEHALKRILVPLDGSALARQALPFAAELARATQAELILLTIAAPPLMARLN